MFFATTFGEVVHPIPAALSPHIVTASSAFPERWEKHQRAAATRQGLLPLIILKEGIVLTSLLPESHRFLRCHYRLSNDLASE